MIRRSPARKRRSAFPFVILAIAAAGLAVAVIYEATRDEGGEGMPATASPGRTPPATSPGEHPRPAAGPSLLVAAPQEVLAAVELPSAEGATALPDGAHLEILATKDGHLWLGGEEVVPPVLAARLAGTIDDPVGAVVTGDRNAVWKSLGRILDACAAPGVGLDRILWRVAGPAGVCVVSMPLADPSESWEGDALEVELHSREGRVEIGIQDPRCRPEPLDEVVDRLPATLRRLRMQRNAETIVVQSNDDVAFGDVFRVAMSAKRAGFRSLHLKCRYAAKFDPTAPVHRLPQAPPVTDPAILTGKYYVQASSERRGNTTTVLSAPDPDRKAVVLPAIKEGRNPEEERVAEILVTSIRSVSAGGQPLSWEYLRGFLFVHAEISRDPTHPNRPARSAVLIRADARAFWRDVRWVMQTCTDPGVRIHRVYLAVRHGANEERALPVFFPPGPLPLKGRQAVEPMLVELRRRMDETAAEVRLFEAEMGTGDPAFDQLAKCAAAARKQMPSGYAVIDAASTVHLVDVAKTISVLHRTGWDDVRFRPGPGPR